MEKRDTFGGIKSINFDATGFFRTQYDGHRWWLVTPLGNAFISFGINHYHDSWWAQDHNREFWINHFNAKEPYDNNWIIGYKDRALNELNILGINSLGIHTDAPMLTSPVGHSIRPYVAQYLPLKLCHYLNPENESFYDIFSDGFSKIQLFFWGFLRFYLTFHWNIWFSYDLICFFTEVFCFPMVLFGFSLKYLVF